MSGTIHILKKNKKNVHTNTSFYHSPGLPKKHNHVEISFNDLTLVYNDPRRFGFFQIVKNKENLSNRFKNYGPEPFDKNFNLEFNKLWIHGLVHLFGYDHKKDKDFNKMTKVEKQFLSYLH